VGEVVRVGTEIQDQFQIGDIVGFGSAIDVCGSCDVCVAGKENYCPHLIQTYGSVHKNGEKTLGGHGTYTRVPSTLVFKVPNGLAPEHAAPLLCAGITVFRPLKDAGAGPGKKVGVVGLGGLGHIAVLFAKAMGADEVVVLSRTSDKKADAFELGATDFVATDEDPEWATKNAGRLDVIINAAGAAKVRNNIRAYYCSSRPMNDPSNLSWQNAD
jgi:alcohol dehydrogenase (NADP+)